jgi:hypothetical protein
VSESEHVLGDLLVEVIWFFVIFVSREDHFCRGALMLAPTLQFHACTA